MTLSNRAVCIFSTVIPPHTPSGLRQSRAERLGLNVWNLRQSRIGEWFQSCTPCTREENNANYAQHIWKSACCTDMASWRHTPKQSHTASDMQSKSSLAPAAPLFVFGATSQPAQEYNRTPQVTCNQNQQANYTTQTHALANTHWCTCIVRCLSRALSHSSRSSLPCRNFSNSSKLSSTLKGNPDSALQH